MRPKRKSFIETMPTNTLIMCKDWDTLKDTTKSLEHIIMKCNPPTLAMPTMATGATVLGIIFPYSTFGGQRRGGYTSTIQRRKTKTNQR